MNNISKEGISSHPFTRRRFVKYGSLAVGTGLLAACANTAQNSETTSTPSSGTEQNQASSSLPKEVRFGSFSIAVDYAPYLIAKNKGWFEKALSAQGIKTNYESFQSLPPINEAFATNRVDVVFEAEPPAIIAKAAGIDVKIVAISCSLVQEILVPANASTQAAADLKGKKIAVLAGTSSHYGVIKLLKESGLSANDVQVIDLAPPDAKSAFDSDKVDAWAVWPPFVEQAELSGKGRVLPRGDASINSVMVTRSEFATQYPATLKQIVGVIEDTKKWIAANPTEAKQIVSKELNVPLEVVDRAWGRHKWDAQLNQTIEEDIQAKSDFFSQNKFIKNSVNVKELIDTSYL